MRSELTLVLVCAALSMRVRPATCHLDQHRSCQNLPTIKIEYYVHTLNQGLRTTDYQPRIKFYQTVYDSVKKVQNKVIIPYETVVKVTCSGTYTDIELIIMTRHGRKLVKSELLRNDIVWTIQTDLFGLEYVYECTDIETACKSSVVISVGPKLEVISPNAQMYIDDFHTNYTVHYGEPASVMCSGPHAVNLVMSRNGEKLMTHRENDTTIKRFVNESDPQTSEYICTDVKTTYNSKVLIKVIPNVYFQLGNETIKPYYVYMYLGNDGYFTQKYYFQHNSSISVFCSVPRAVEFIGRKEDGTTLLAENLNDSTAYINISKLGILDYTCGHIGLSDYSKTVQVIILPRIEVTSPGVRVVGLDQYTVTYGHPLDISCSGPDASHLKISDQWGLTNSEEQTVNKTTLKYIINKAVFDKIMTFTCFESGIFTREKASIQVGVLPAVTDFRCVSNNLQYVNCTWTNININGNNILYYTENGILTHICDKPRSSSRSKFCVWDYEYENGKNIMRVLNFLIKSCCDYGCTNQTFSYEHLSIVKLDPPKGLKVLRTTPRSALLQWNATMLYFAREYLTPKRGQLHHKVEYRYSGIEPKDVNSSLATCDNEYCKIELDLPCAGQFYEVRIYEKLKEAIGEYWSEPSSVSFYTDGEADTDNIDGEADIDNIDGEADTDNIDPTCNQEPIKTKEVMKYFAQELRQDVRDEMEKMKQEIDSLHDKLAIVNKYLSQAKVKKGEIL